MIACSPLAVSHEPLTFIAPDESGDVSLAAFTLGAPDDFLRRTGGDVLTLPAELERAVPKRKAEYLAGRAAGALALSRCGSPDRHIGRNGDGSPRWPDGFVGALTHGAGLAAAAVAPALRYLGIGIDAEYLLKSETAEEVVESVALPSELAAVALGLPGADRETAVTILFSAKESLFKCLFPLVGEFFGFHDARLVEVQENGAGGGVFRLQLARSLDCRFARGWGAAGRFSIANGRVQTALGVRQ